jgi:outer membrane protein assembly factor BamD
MFLAFLYCSKNTRPEMTTADEEFKQSVKYFEEEDYKRTINSLKYFFNRYPGSHWIDDAQFYFAESYYQIGSYAEALSEFQFLLNNFANSEFSEKGLLRKAQCLERMAPIPQRDQTLTKEALETYEEFITRYPYSKYLEEAKASKKSAEERINQKMLEIGETYVKMGILESAIIYLTKVSKKSGKWKDKANYLLGDIALSNNNDSLAVYYYQKVEGELQEEAEKKLIEIQ